MALNPDNLIKLYHNYALSYQMLIPYLGKTYLMT